MSYSTPFYVLSLFPKLVGRCQNNVLLGLRLIEKIERFPDPTKEEIMLFQMILNEHLNDINESKLKFKRWILKNGFEDIHNYFRNTLERIYEYKKLENKPDGLPLSEIEEIRERYMKSANRFGFPDLVKEVEKLLSTPLELKSNLLSINSARNCFVHRNGIVGPEDINNQGNASLEIIVNRFIVYFETPTGEEIVAEIGVPGPENSPLKLRREEGRFEFRLGEEINLSLKNFLEILQTCIVFNSEISVLLDTKVN
ncbi:MAG: hypothetical protein H6581_06400 [Bacteroidia bacterium]|nr:hypothetical protein [Bacteroidia bacterium]